MGLANKFCIKNTSGCCHDCLTITKFAVQIFLLFLVSSCLSVSRAMQSLIVSPNGESFHLRSFSELERQLLCSYNL